MLCAHLYAYISVYIVSVPPFVYVTMYELNVFYYCYYKTVKTIIKFYSKLVRSCYRNIIVSGSGNKKIFNKVT